MKIRPVGRELPSFVLHVVLAAAVFALALSLAAGAAMLLRWAVPLELASSSTQRALLATGHILELNERFWPVTLVSFVAVVVSAGWLGRRITGPLVRFVRVFERLSAGELPEPIQIRATDYLAAEVRALNELLAALRARGSRRAGAYAELVGTLEELAERAREQRDETSAALAARALDEAKALDGPAA